MRKKKGISSTTVLLVLFIVAATAAAWFFLQYTSLSKTANELISMQEANTKTVYVATGYIDKGTELSATGNNANVQKQIIQTGLEAYNYITDAELGSIALVDIPTGTPVMYNMVSALSFEKDTREYEISVVNLATNQHENDYVDVRISFPNGEDYIILAKKPIKNLFLDNCVFSTYCNEEEILRMTSAIIDAYTTTGAYIYTTKYVNSNVQETATPNYLVRAETIDLINSSPNVLTKAIETLNLSARINLETRLGKITEDELAAVSEGYGIADTAKTTVYSAIKTEEESYINNND